jgi:hypothetical protein
MTLYFKIHNCHVTIFGAPSPEWCWHRCDRRVCVNMSTVHANVSYKVTAAVTINIAVLWDVTTVNDCKQGRTASTSGPGSPRRGVNLVWNTLCRPGWRYRIKQLHKTLSIYNYTAVYSCTCEKAREPTYKAPFPWCHIVCFGILEDQRWNFNIHFCENVKYHTKLKTHQSLSLWIWWE